VPCLTETECSCETTYATADDDDIEREGGFAATVESRLFVSASAFDAFRSMSSTGVCLSHLREQR
jgi:hypothetical protein